MNDITTLINKIKEKVKKYFSEDATGHSIDHLERTLNYALYLQKKEGGDIVVVAISAFIHDIHRIMGSEQHRFVSPKESLPVVETFLNDLEITDKQKQHILYAIEHHEEYSFGSEKVSVTDVESKILQDADNLDAIGAIGLARTFKFCFAHNIKEFEPNVELYRNDFNENKNDISIIHHIHNKLLRLGDYMNTNSAKKLAEEKTKLMQNFLDMYLKEYNGNF